MKELNIAKYLDSTYLKTAAESGITELENKEVVLQVVDEAIANKFACIMIRPDFVSIAVDRIVSVNSDLKVGTVIDFPSGCNITHLKLQEAKSVIMNGAWDIDFVCDYNAFKICNFSKFDTDILECTKLCVDHKKIAKWIIETGALSKDEIVSISKRITKLIYSHFPNSIEKVFIKTSTGYYRGYGANMEDVKLIKSVSKDLQIKASGGISNIKDALKFINIGVDRIGTSKAKLIYDQYLIE
ncbi:MAG: deoxyribose-phosphate aldolase [Flavobacteriales bacterium]|nr:deoxyribose-phosphate aldolase [Flavobacteriales bacterium]